MIPSLRLTLALCAGACFFFLTPLVPPLYFAGWLFDCLILAACLVDAVLLRQATQLQVARECDATLSLAAHNPVTLRAANRAHFPIRFHLKDAPPPGFQVDQRQFTATLRPGESWTATYQVTPPERGDFDFGRLYLRCRTPLGLLIRGFTTPADLTVKVYPNVSEIRKYELLARQDRARQMGLRQTKRMGAGLEFERLREYQPDDEPRRLDWKATARRADLMTREYEIERSQNVMLLLDLGRTMASRLETLTKVDLAVNACVLIAYIAALADDHVGLYTFAAEPGALLPPARGKGQVLRLLEALYRVRGSTEEANYRTAFAFFSAQLRKRALVIVFTDLIDPDSSRRLIETIPMLTGKHLVVCVAFGDHELTALVRRKPEASEDVYRQSVAIAMLEDRRLAIAELSRRGVLVVDAGPSNLGVAVVNKYLELKRGGRV
jgi:uncharacterized protein (DUF58 family)